MLEFKPRILTNSVQELLGLIPRLKFICSTNALPYFCTHRTDFRDLWTPTNWFLFLVCFHQFPILARSRRL